MKFMLNAHYCHSPMACVYRSKDILQGQWFPISLGLRYSTQEIKRLAVLKGEHPAIVLKI